MNWYDYYLRDDLISAARKKLIENRLIRLARKFMCPVPNPKALDIGCGDGCFLRKLRNGLSRDSYGLEYSERLADLLSVKKGLPLIVRAMALKLPFKRGTFDLIFINNVMHHLRDMKEYLICIEEAIDTLSEKGLLIVCEPLNTPTRGILKKAISLPAIRQIPAVRHNLEKYISERERFDRWLSLQDETFRNIGKKAISAKYIGKGFFKIYAVYGRARETVKR